MSFKKLSRIAMVAFVLVAVLAVSAFAYGVDVAGMVTGLENGVNYTYAQYDFATDAYGEVTELTADTVLTSGVWGIKADGEEDYSPVFVYGSQTGHMSYLDYTLLGKSGTATPTGNESVGKVIDSSNDLEYLSPGKWSTSGMGNGTGAYYQVSTYPQYYTNGTNAVSLYMAILPGYFADWKDVTVGEEDEAVTTKQWVVKDTVTGYDTADEMLQASSIYYGFSNEQVVPAKAFKGFTSGSYGFSLGFTGTNCSAITFTPRITYYVKNPGSETIGEYYYVVEGFVSKNAITFGVPADMPEEGYIVGFRLQPYYDFTVEQLLDIPTQYNNKDDGYTIRTQPKYVSGAVTEDAQTTRASHFGLHPNDNNDFEYTAPTYAAPAENFAIVNGKVTGLIDGAKYQYCQSGAEDTVYDLTANTLVYGTIKIRKTDASGELVSPWTEEYTSDRTAAPTGISFVDGMPVDLEDGILYQYRNLSVGNGVYADGKAFTLAEGEAVALTAESTGVYGLVQVREISPCGSYSTAWSAVIYSAGEDHDIVNAENKALGGDRTDGVTGTTYSKGDYLDILSIANLGLTVSNDNYKTYATTWYFAEEKWAAVGTSNDWSATTAMGAPLAISANNASIPLGWLVETAYKAWQADTTSEALKAAYDAACLEATEAIENEWFSYKLAADEIIPMNEFGSHKFYPASSMWSVSFSGTMYAKAKYTLIVVTDEGEIEGRSVFTEKYVVSGFNKSYASERTQTVTLADFVEAGYETDGYIVGIVIQPCGSIESTHSYVPKYTSAGALYNSRLQVNFFADGWTVNEFVPVPTGLSIANGKVTGLESGRTYEYCQVIDGVEGEAQALTANTVVYGDIKVRVYSAKDTTAVSAWTEALTSDRTAAPTGISFVDGMPVDLEDGLLYQYRNVSIGDSIEIEYSEEATLDAASTDVYGLVQVREISPCGSYSTAWSDIIYSAGESYDIIHTKTLTNAKYPLFYLDGTAKEGYTATDAYYRKDLTTSDSTGKFYSYADDTLYTGTGTFYQLFVDTNGAYNFLKSGKYYLATDGTTETAKGTAQYTTATYSVKYPITNVVTPVWNGNNLNSDKVFKEGAWSGNSGTSRTINYGWHSLNLSTTGGWNDSDTNIGELGTGEISSDKLADAQSFASHWWYSYEFTPEEIVPMSSFASYTYSVRRDNGAWQFKGTLCSAFSLVVINDEGEVEVRKVVKDLVTSTVFATPGGRDVTVTLDDFAETDGYIVGIIINPYDYSKTTAINKSNDNNNQYTVFLYEDGFKVEVSALDVTGGETINGIDADKTYQYKSYTINSDGSALEATEWTALDHNDIPAGLLRVREIISDTIVTAPSNLIYVYGDEADRKDLGTWVDDKHSTGTAFYATQNIEAFVTGTWTGIGATTHKSYATNRISPTGSNYVSAANAETAATLYQAYLAAKEAYEADASETNATALTEATDAYEAQAAILCDAFTTKWFGYAYEANEIIPASEVYSFIFKTGIRQGASYAEPYTSVVKVYVTDLEGKVTEHVYTTEAIKAGQLRTIDFTSDENWDEVNGRPTNGYIVGIKVYTSAGMTDLYGWTLGAKNDTMPYIDIVEYNIKAELAAPTVEFVVTDKGTHTNELKITDYNEAYTYEYSDDNGLTWNELEGESLFVTDANTVYYVQATDALGNVSKIATATSPKLILQGASLVLGGQIAIRAYFDVDIDAVDDISVYISRVNADYEEYASSDTSSDEYKMYKHGGTATRESSQYDWMSEIKYNENNGLWYVDFYVAAKDVDNVRFETRFYFTDIDATEKTECARPGIDVALYVDGALTSEDAAFVEAKPVIQALVDYAKYADNYFGTADALEAYTSTALAGATIDAANCTDSLANLEFVGTSLLLEDNVTIRHYFKVVGDYTFDAEDYAVDPTTVTVKTKNDGYYVCFDITDVPAHKIGDAYTLTITGAEGKADAGNVATVTYSVANYLANASSSYEAGTKMYNLANVMYDYYVEAKAYYDLKH